MTRCLLVHPMLLSWAPHAMRPVSRPGMAEPPRSLSGAPARRLGEIRRRPGEGGQARRDLRSRHAARRVGEGPPIGLARPHALSRHVPDPDALSQLLLRLSVTSSLYCLSRLTAPWGFQVGARPMPAFHLLLSG